MNPILEALPDSPGVYVLKNKITGDEYIGGATRSIRKRVQGHIGSMKSDGFQTSRELKKLARKHGVESFSASVFLLCSANLVRVFEREAIHKLAPSLNKSESKRQPRIKIPVLLYCRLQHLAIDADTSAEKLGGKLIEQAVLAEEERMSKLKKSK